MLDTNKIQALLDECEKIGNLTIFDSFVKAYPKIDTKQCIVCCISGGSDSDVMLDLLTKIDTEKKIKYVFFDTGIEYEATKKHLDCLEQKYGIKIEKIKAIKPVPLGCRQYGLPFWSKYVSEMIERLQRHNFKWEDRPYDELIQEYPKCQIALKWWCNCNEKVKGKESRFNIAHVKWLKEYMIANPPTFKISKRSCTF